MHHTSSSPNSPMTPIACIIQNTGRFALAEIRRVPRLMTQVTCIVRETVTSCRVSGKGSERVVRTTQGLGYFFGALTPGVDLNRHNWPWCPQPSAMWGDFPAASRSTIALGHGCRNTRRSTSNNSTENLGARAPLGTHAFLSSSMRINISRSTTVQPQCQQQLEATNIMAHRGIHMSSFTASAATR